MLTTEQTLKLVESIKAQQTVEKAFTTGLGLNWFDLEPAAKLLYPVITPLRNMIPRVSGDGGLATNWKAITGINTTNVSPGVSEGNRNAVITTSEVDYTAPYRGLGLEDYETWEAEYGSQNFDNLRALMVQGLLNSLMIAEENTIIGGNGSTGIALGTPAQPVIANAGTGGTIAAGTYDVGVVALTLDGYQRSTVSAAGVATQIARTNADASSDTINGGSSNKSAVSSTTTTSGSTSSITATVTAIKGAVAYAWYLGTAGNEKLVAITTVNAATFTALPAGGNQALTAISADNSKNALVFDGIITQALSGTGYFKSLDGAALTTDNAGGIVEIDAAFKSFWDNYRISPQIMLVNAQELLNITKKTLAAGSGTLFQLTANGANQGGVSLTAGSVVASYLNKFTMSGGQVVEIMLHPNVPPGTIIFFSKNTPYPISKVRNILQVKTRREYYQIEWPYRSRKYEAGVYCDELLQMYATFAFGVISNILNG